MSYLVVETHPAYAVLLDEEGRFIKAANLRYQVGDSVGDIVALRTPREKSRPLGRSLTALAALAACFCMVFFGYYRPNYTAYGTLRIQINPDVEMTISRTQRVLALEGLNQDGVDLIQGYSYRGKDQETATEELVERAIALGYLSDGGAISISVDSSDGAWQAEEASRVRLHLEERYGARVVIHLVPVDQDAPSPTPSPSGTEVVIPVPPQTPSATPPAPATPRPTAADTDYDDTDYGPNNDGVTDYDDTDYGPNADGVTDYDDTDYGPNADGVTDYDDTDYGPNADGVTDYGDTDYGPSADGVTGYDDTDYSAP